MMALTFRRFCFVVSLWLFTGVPFGACAQEGLPGGVKGEPAKGEPLKIETPKVEPSKPEASRPDPKADQASTTPSTFVLAVIGDSQAQMLGQGLTEAFADNPNIRILRLGKQDTGLVRTDFFDWGARVDQLLKEQQHIDMAVILIGINDNQPITTKQGDVEPSSPQFKELYLGRATNIAEAFKAKGVTLIWVGQPIMRSDTLSQFMLGLNEIDRRVAAATGARYVDLWEAFSNVSSHYDPFGPDVNGAIVRLRAADGVHMNKAGARKAAQFLEGDIRRAAMAQEARLASQAAPSTETSSPSQPSVAALPAPAIHNQEQIRDEHPAALSFAHNLALYLMPAPFMNWPPIVSNDLPQQAAPPPPKPIAGPVLSLTAPEQAAAAELASFQDARASAALMPVPSKVHRADDFSWPAVKTP